MVKNEDGTYARGYKLAKSRTLLDSAGLLEPGGDVRDPGTRRRIVSSLVGAAPVLRAGDLLLEDRGFIDGAMLSHLKRKRRVDIIMPLKANMLATQEAMQLAELADSGERIPQGPISALPGIWRGAYVDECEVPLNACVIHFWNRKKSGPTISSWSRQIGS